LPEEAITMRTLTLLQAAFSPRSALTALGLCAALSGCGPEYAELAEGAEAIAEVSQERIAAGSTTLSGWTVTGDIDYVSSTFWPSADGTRSVDLNHVAAGGISQCFATQSGRSYRVDFSLAGNPERGSPLIKTLRVSAAGTSQDYTFDVSTTSYQNMGWVRRSFAFTANSTCTTVAFTSLTTGALGPAVDAISLTAL
jgi:choice-of-anchor C domain-containing protein